MTEKEILSDKHYKTGRGLTLAVLGFAEKIFVEYEIRKINNILGFYCCNPQNGETIGLEN